MLDQLDHRKTHGEWLAWVDANCEFNVRWADRLMQVAKLVVDYQFEDKTVVRKLKTEEAKRDYVVKINLCRRHLDPIQWGLAFIQLLEIRGVKRGKGKNQKEQTATVAVCADELGVSKRTAEHRLSQADKWKTNQHTASATVAEAAEELGVSVRT